MMFFGNGGAYHELVIAVSSQFKKGLCGKENVEVKYREFKDILRHYFGSTPHRPVRLHEIR